MLLCPTCRVDLHIAKRQDVEIDHCPQCRGVWLDRGELDKIIKRTIEVASPRRRGESERFSREDRDEDGMRSGMRSGVPRESAAVNHGLESCLTLVSTDLTSAERDAFLDAATEKTGPCGRCAP